MPRWRHNYDAFASGSIIDDRGITTAVDSAGHLEGGGEGTQQVVDDSEEGEGQRDQPQQQACT